MKHPGPKCPVPKCHSMDAKRPKGPGAKHPGPKRSGANCPCPSRHGAKCPGPKRPGAKCPGPKRPGLNFCSHIGLYMIVALPKVSL